MLRASKRQLDQLRALYGELKTHTTKHSVYIEASPEEAANYKRLLSGNLSKRQKNALFWYYKKRHRTQEAPAD